MMVGSTIDAAQLRSRRVLVIEDDLAAQEALAELVTDQGHEVRTATNGQEALAILRREQVDLIVLDLWMPVMDGWQFRAVQRADASLSAVPVIAISADRSPQAQAIHADCYVGKPIDRAQLVFAMERILLGQERQRLTEKLKETERLTMLGTIAASIGHEVNNPLTYVLGNVHLLRQRLAAARRRPSELVDSNQLEEMAKLLGEVLIGAERIQAVMTTLQTLTWDREEGQSEIDLRVLLDTSLAIAWNEIRHRARVTREFEDVPFILGDEARLGQVFVNLMTNAAHAIPSGRCESNEIGVGVRRRGDAVVVEIRDTGAGIPAELQDRVFEPFFTTRRREGGSGIGLTLSKNIIEEHGGRIELASLSGKGSILRVVLPVAPAPAHPQLGPVAGEIQGAAHARGRVLVIDDDPLVVEAVRRMLEPAHDVTTTTHARDALAKLAAGRAYDAIVCDVMMPEMNGVQFYAEIERHHPGLGSRVIFMTGGILMPEVRAFRGATTNAWLDKPFLPKSLLRQVAQVIAAARGV